MKEFIEKWRARHQHPVNIILHVIGIPATMVGGTLILFKPVIVGISWIIAGYVLQYVGHLIEHSEMGELMILQHIYKKLFSSRR